MVCRKTGRLIRCFGKEVTCCLREKKNVMPYVIMGVFLLVCLVGSILLGTRPKAETIQEVMKDAVLHETGKIAFLGMEVNPAVISDLIITGIVLVFAACMRIFVIPKFRYTPGKLQLLLEMWVGYFSDLAKTNSPHHSGFIGAYAFGAGSYIFLSTIFELLGIQGVTTHGISVALPAPLSDINGAIALGCLTYLVILIGGIVLGGPKGAVNALKDFSLPISMSFRLFGALLSGLLVTELVYYSIRLSFILPVIVGVLFTLIHAVIQTYVLTMLATTFFGESTEPHPKKEKKNKKQVKEQAAA